VLFLGYWYVRRLANRSGPKMT